MLLSNHSLFLSQSPEVKVMCSSESTHRRENSSCNFNARWTTQKNKPLFWQESLKNGPCGLLTCSSIECLDSPPFRVWEPVARQLRQRRRPTIQRRGRRRQDLRPGTCWQMPFAASFAKFARWFLMQVNLACVKAEQFRCMVLGFLLFLSTESLGAQLGI